MPASPMVASPERNSRCRSCATAGTCPACCAEAAEDEDAWVTTKTPKIGARIVTDSLTPRRFITTSRPMTSASTSSFAAAHSWGRTEKIWSAPAAIETAMVST